MDKNTNLQEIEKGCAVMVRQCAWCLCLIDMNGERLSSTPLPKSYEATHGMCSICGALWIEQVLSAQAPQAPQFPLLLMQYPQSEVQNVECSGQSSGLSQSQNVYPGNSQVPDEFALENQKKGEESAEIETPTVQALHEIPLHQL